MGSTLICSRVSHGLYLFHMGAESGITSHACRRRISTASLAALFISNNSPTFSKEDDVGANNSTSLVSLWHQRLGHPFMDVTKIVMTYCNISFAKNNVFVCSACPMSKNK